VTAPLREKGFEKRTPRRLLAHLRALGWFPTLARKPDDMVSREEFCVSEARQKATSHNLPEEAVGMTSRDWVLESIQSVAYLARSNPLAGVD
jgi:hypothetical protein